MDHEHDFSSYLKLINNCDPHDPLLTSTSLGRRLEQVYIAQVQLSDLNQLNQALNLEQLIRTNDGLPRDYRGLAELMGFSSIEIETRFKRSYNPTKSLIDAYINKNTLNNSQSSRAHHQTKQFNLNELLKMIEQLERFDIIDDLLPTLIKLASINQLVHHYERENLSVKSRDNNSDRHEITQRDDSPTGDLDRLTIDDSSRFKAYYDAFICFAPEDSDHAEELICLLEQNDKRIATAHDILPGHFEHEALVQLIDMRCRKIIIILTSNFLRSKECEFQLKFASEIAIRSGSPKIIPVLYEHCDDSSLPYMIRVLSKIDMTNRQAHGWQMRKLLHSLNFSHLDSNYVPSNRPTSSGHDYQFHNQHRQDSTHIKSNNLNNINNIQMPAITLSEAHHDDYKIAILDDNLGPIVDLAHSQCLSTTSTSNNNSSIGYLSDDGSHRTNSISSSQIRQSKGGSSPKLGSGSTNKPMDWFRQVRRRVLGGQEVSNAVRASTTSRALLISNNSEDSITSGYEKINGPDD